MHSYGLVQTDVTQLDVATLPTYWMSLMVRNVATDGYRFADPYDEYRFSQPGCIVASPSYERDQADVKQNYVFNWTRDAAVTAIEIAQGRPFGESTGPGILSDYVRFAAACQQAVGATDPQSVGGLAHACYLVDAQPREPWAQQNDGPALQVIALLTCYDQLAADVATLARSVIAANAAFVLQYYQNANNNLWEEVFGFSFFTRAVQLRCLLELKARPLGLTLTGIDAAIVGLRAALDTHWNDAEGYYVSILEPADLRPGYDPNIDIVTACIYGAVSPTDPRLLATAGKLRQQWTDPATSSVAYPINVADAQSGLGPLLGRYPGDVYDGDDNSSGLDHPWVLCTANVAELYYRLAAELSGGAAVGYSTQTALFFDQVGVGATTTATDAIDLLRTAGDRMVKAIVFHSDHLELSEQFDAQTGFEKSVRNLTWSYAALLSALRMRAQT